MPEVNDEHEMILCEMRFRFLIYVLFSLPLQGMTGTVVINEVSYSNKTVLFDQDGDSPDWFELFNTGDMAVNLSGYGVTDDTSKTSWWVFPDYILEPGSHLIVFASDKDIRKNLPMHTDFKLSNMKESLFLLDPAGNIIDEVRPSCIPTDRSLARLPDGSQNLVIIVPTPGQTNDHARTVEVHYIRDTLTISHPGGLYEEPLTVSLLNNHAMNKILYTLDGDTPDEESFMYEHPLYFDDLTPNKNRFACLPEEGIRPGDMIFKANILRAVVYSEGCPASNEVTGTYFISKDIRNKYNVPIISMITDKDNLFDDDIGIYVLGNHNNYYQHGDKWERKAHLEIFDTSGTRIISQACGIRIHGRGSRHYPQKSFRLYADKEYGTEYFNYPFFSQKPKIDRFKTLLLRTTNVSAETLIKNDLCSHLVQEMDVDYQATETAVVFVNGEYWGIYGLSERQDEYYVENNYDLTVPGIDIIGYNWLLEVEEGDLQAYNSLIEFLKDSDPSSPEFYEEVGKKMDLSALMDYYIAMIYLANTDWPVSNLKLWKIRSDTAKWRYFFFDLDEVMEWINYDMLSVYNNTLVSYREFPGFSTFILSTLLKNEDFRKDFHARFIRHLNTTFLPGRVIGWIDHFKSVYKTLVPENLYRWHMPLSMAEWEKDIEQLKSFAIQRPVFLAKQLKENFGNPFFIYPNPVSGNAIISFAGDMPVDQVSVYSIEGILLENRQLTEPKANNCLLELTLPPGIYLLKLSAGGKSYSEKLVVQ